MARRNRRLLGGVLLCLAVVSAVYGFGTAQANGSLGAAIAVVACLGSAWYLIRDRQNK